MLHTKSFVWEVKTFTSTEVIHKDLIVFTFIYLKICVNHSKNTHSMQNHSTYFESIEAWLSRDFEECPIPYSSVSVKHGIQTG